MKTSFLAFSTLAFTASLCATDNGFKSSTLIAMAPVVMPVVAADNEGGPVPATSTTVEALFAEADTTIESSTLKNHTGLSALGDRVTRGINDQIKAWKSQGFTAPLESDELVSRALLDFTQKLSALNLATNDTWISVKSDALSSLHHLQGAYGDLQTDSTKK